MTMSEPKTFASLGPTLLARKGGAKPAMRPQLAPLTAGAQTAEAVAPDPEELEDLGWNDMGHAEDEPHEAQIFALSPMAGPAEAGSEAYDDEEDEEDTVLAVAAEEPLVRRQQREIVTAISARHREPVQVVRRAAFTLRLDARRHLKLRLASTVMNRSSQQLVTQALDKFLADIPEIDALAAQVSLD